VIAIQIHLQRRRNSKVVEILWAFGQTKATGSYTPPAIRSVMLQRISFRSKVKAGRLSHGYYGGRCLELQLRKR